MSSLRRNARARLWDGAHGPIAIGFVIAALATSSALAYEVAPATSDNVIHVQLDDRAGLTDGVTIGAEVTDVPDWVDVTDVVVSSGAVTDVMVRFDVGDVALGQKGHARVQVTGTLEDGAVVFEGHRMIALTVFPAVDPVQRAFGIDECCMEIIGVDELGSTPAAHRLVGNTPNPFRPLTSIVFGLPVEGGVVELTIFDIQGRQIRSFTTPRLGGGFHRITWDGKNEIGKDVSPGTYFYRVSSGTWNETRKMQRLP